MSNTQSRELHGERPRPLLARARLPAARLAAERRGQGRLRDLRLGPQGRDAEPRADRAGDPGPAEDAPPRRQRRRRGRRLRPAARHPAQDLGRGGPRRRPRPLAGPRRRLRRRPHLRRALARTSSRSSTTPASCSASGGFRILAERDRRGRLARARPDRARGGAALLAARRPRRRRRAPRPRPLRPADRARAAARRPRPLLLGDHLRLQGDGRAEGPRRVLPRPARRALRDDRLLRPQPLLDQHLALVQARPAVLGARPQRRDQHDRAAAPGGADARRADPAPAPRTRRTSTARSTPWSAATGLSLAEAMEMVVPPIVERDPRAARGAARASTCTCARRWARSRRARWR